MFSLVAFSTRLFSVLRFESVIHEFDPYFNYRTTRYLTEEGFYSFHNWFDDRAWYPLGRIIGGTIYPGEKFHLSNTFKSREICMYLIVTIITNVRQIHGNNNIHACHLSSIFLFLLFRSFDIRKLLCIFWGG